MIKNILSLLFLLCFQACSPSVPTQEESNSEKTDQEVLYKSESFTNKNEFTTGIEGPAVDSRGKLYVVNFEKEGTIGQITPEGVASLFVNLPEGSIANGIRFNSKGDMLVADYQGHKILQVDMNTKQITVHAHEDKMHQPNDIAIMDNDILFASDPNWNNSTGQLWRINPDGSTHLLEKEMGTVNGIEVSPDNTKLYINESVQRNVWAYDLSEEGGLSNKRLLIQFEDHGMDGMRCDGEGNLYITRHGKGTVVKISPEGELLQEITTSGSKPSNIAFGGVDGKTAYVTIQDIGNIDSFRVEDAGREFLMTTN